MNGWNIYERLCHDLDYSQWKETGPVNVTGDACLIEVHPHASFVVGLGWIPQAKVTLSGQLERAGHLLEAAKWNGQNLIGDCLPKETLISEIATYLRSVTWDAIRSNGIRLTSFSHDVLDALAGLLTAIHAADGRAFAVGDSAEGVIVLPSQPVQSYRQKQRS